MRAHRLGAAPSSHAFRKAIAGASQSQLPHQYWPAEVQADIKIPYGSLRYKGWRGQETTQSNGEAHNSKTQQQNLGWDISVFQGPPRQGPLLAFATSELGVPLCIQRAPCN